MLTLTAFSDIIQKLIININDEENTMKLVKITIAIAACLLIGQSAFANTVTVTLQNGTCINSQSQCKKNNVFRQFRSGRTVILSDDKQMLTTFYIPRPKNTPLSKATKTLNVNSSSENFKVKICVGKDKKCNSGKSFKFKKDCKKILVTKRDGKLGNAGRNIAMSCEK